MSLDGQFRIGGIECHLAFFLIIPKEISDITMPHTIIDLWTCASCRVIESGARFGLADQEERVRSEEREGGSLQSLQGEGEECGTQ